jgi:hypothetical protein
MTAPQSSERLSATRFTEGCTISKISQAGRPAEGATFVRLSLSSTSRLAALHSVFAFAGAFRQDMMVNVAATS